ncbi:MAG: glycosyltransferase [Longimicrobiales bacterium]
MRILLMSHAAGRYGAERVLMALARGLAERGHDVVLELPHEGPALDRVPEQVTVRVGTRRPLPRNAREAVGWLATAGTSVREARRTINEIDADLIWINSLYHPWGAIAARLSRRPVVWHLHEYPLPEPMGLATAALVGAVATRVAAISEFVADGWSRYPWLRRRIDRIPNPLLDDKPTVDPPSGPFTVGYIGQLEPRKRATDVVRAVARLTDVHGVIVGDGKDRPATEAVIRDVRAADRIRLVGFTPDVAAEMAHFHCVAIPSLREPFGLVALEAMAAGLPVVAARSGALPEVLGPAALYHDPGDPDDLADQIRTIKADPVLRQQLIQTGRRRVRTYRRGPWLDRAEAIARAAVNRTGGTK